jgi:hypothetical protein
VILESYSDSEEEFLEFTDATADGGDTDNRRPQQERRGREYNWIKEDISNHGIAVYPTEFIVDDDNTPL